jgi:hypothetical protein
MVQAAVVAQAKLEQMVQGSLEEKAEMDYLHQ